MFWFLQPAAQKKKEKESTYPNRSGKRAQLTLRSIRAFKNDGFHVFGNNGKVLAIDMSAHKRRSSNSGTFLFWDIMSRFVLSLLAIWNGQKKPLTKQV